MPAEEPAIELYGCMTPNVLKVMFMLGELDLPFALDHVRIYRGENFAAGFEALHPYRKLPVLIDRDGPGGELHRVFESGAILFYLAEKTGRLFGRDARERSAAMQWLMLQMSSIGPAFGNATHFNRAAGPGEDYARARFVTQAARLCEAIDARLAQAPFLAGEDFSIADIATFPWLWRHPGMVGIPTDGWPHLQGWIARIAVRPGFQAIHPRYREMARIDMEDVARCDAATLDRLMGRGDWSWSGQA